eukprot:4985942-Pyramimonas_sp.AAC.1
MRRGRPCHVVGFTVMSSKNSACPCFPKYLPGPGSTSALVPVPGRRSGSGGNDVLVNVICLKSPRPWAGLGTAGGSISAVLAKAFKRTGPSGSLPLDP